MKVKICGITNLEDALLCEESGAHLLGFVFYEKSKRFISQEIAYEIIRQLSDKIFKVGVFVNASAETINRCVNELKLDFVQLHGDETPQLAEQIDTKIIRAFRVKDRSSFSAVRNFPGVIPLFDTYKKENYGGTGQTFDWSLIPRELGKKYLLSGGISVGNIREAVLKTKPYAVDLSSSLESVPGRKDHKKVQAFFSVLHEALQ